MTHNSGWGGFPVGRSGRWLLVAWGLFLLGGFALAYRLEPDPRGFGTHQGLGLPPCTFRELCGLPCPSCGMTTSFSHFTRGQFSQAMHANFGGMFLALVCVAIVPWSLASAASGKLLGVHQPAKTLLWVVLAVCGVALAAWLIQLLPR